MFKFLRNKKAQSTLEYAVLIGVVVGALIAMQSYIKRGYQGKLKESSDSMGQQFSPSSSSSSFTTNSYSRTAENSSGADGGTANTEILNQWTSRDGTENIQALNHEWWPTDSSD